jgi:hypothetical protein
MTDALLEMADAGTMSFQAETERGVIVLPTPAAMLDYELAVADFCYNRDLAALYRTLLALGISGGDCRWHAGHPGQSLDDRFHETGSHGTCG